MNNTKGYFAAVLLTLVFPLLAQAQSTVNYDWLTQGEVSGWLVGADHAIGRIALDGNPLDDINALRRVAMTLTGKRLEEWGQSKVPESSTKHSLIFGFR